MITSLYERIRAALEFVPPDDRDTWLRMAIAVKSELGEEGFCLWDQWSQRGESYNEHDAKRAWESIRPGGKVTVATLYYVARRYGWQGQPNGHDRATERTAVTPSRARIVVEDLSRVDRERKARVRSTEIWKDAEPAPADHPYLIRKGVKPYGLKLFCGAMSIRGMSCNGALIVPLRDANDEFSSLEFIDPAGAKRFLPGGRKSGCYHLMGLPADVLVIAEGYATAASIHQATDYATVCAFDAGNLMSVAKTFRAHLPNVRIIIAADNDSSKNRRNIGVEKAKEAASAVGGLVAVPGLDGMKCDFNDLMATQGADAVRATIASAQPPSETSEAVIPSHDASLLRNGVVMKRISDLARLSRVQYDHIRESTAKELGIRVTTLDAEVGELRKERLETKAAMFEDPEPWPTFVDGAVLLNRVRDEIEKYVALPPQAATAIALWTLHTWCFDAFNITPFLYLRSPEKRCGKTTLMLVIRELVQRSLLVTNASTAALFRCIEEFRPTLLLDEADAWLQHNEELRGILNGGHSRKSAHVIRTVGDNHDVRVFSTYCPKAIAGIGRLADTLEDRSIIIPMQRKRPEDRIAPMREDRFDLLDIRRQCRRWADDHIQILREANPDGPHELNDRAADNWRALLAIADVARGNWPADARSSARALSGRVDDEAVGTLLLTDIRDYFTQKQATAVSSSELVDFLATLEGHGWAEWGKSQKPISQNQLARLLKRFTIHPRDVRLGAKVVKGYLREHFEDAFVRYLSTLPQGATVLQPHPFGSQSVPSGRNGLEQAATERYTPYGAECSNVADRKNPVVASQNDRKAHKRSLCCGVADQSQYKVQDECTEEVF